MRTSARALGVLGAALALAAAACGEAGRRDATTPITETPTTVASASPTTAEGIVDREGTAPPTSASPPTEPRTVAGIPRPPRVVVSDAMTTLELDAWTFCVRAGCVDGMPPDPLPAIGAGDRLTVSFPLDGWTFQADVRRADDPCGRHQQVDLEHIDPTTFAVTPVGAAGTYAVTLWGRGTGTDRGDLFVGFEWTTTVDGPLARPEAQLSVLADNNGRIDSYGVELRISNLARTPLTADATVTVTTADGSSLTFSPPPEATAAPEVCPGIEGSVDWRAPKEQGLAAAALGPGPFTYDVVVTLDGVEHRATAHWPADQTPGLEPNVTLDFSPPLPAPTS